VNTIRDKKIFGWYCRIFGAVTALTLLFSIFDFSSFVGRLVKYFIYFSLSAFIIWKREKEEKPKVKKYYYPFALSLFLSFSIFLSYLFKSKTVLTYDLSIISFVFICILTPIFEELFFRCAIMYNDKSLAFCVFSSILFSLFHTPDIFLYTLFMGFVLAYYYRVTHSLVFGVLCHMLNNTLAFITPLFDVRPILLVVTLLYSIIYVIKNKDNTNDLKQ